MKARVVMFRKGNGYRVRLQPARLDPSSTRQRTSEIKLAQIRRAKPKVGTIIDELIDDMHSDCECPPVTSQARRERRPETLHPFIAKAARLQREQPHAAALIEETIDDILAQYDDGGGGKGA